MVFWTRYPLKNLNCFATKFDKSHGRDGNSLRLCFESQGLICWHLKTSSKHDLILLDCMFAFAPCVLPQLTQDFSLPQPKCWSLQEEEEARIHFSQKHYSVAQLFRRCQAECDISPDKDTWGVQPGHEFTQQPDLEWGNTFFQMNGQGLKRVRNRPLPRATSEFLGPNSLAFGTH